VRLEGLCKLKNPMTLSRIEIQHAKNTKATAVPFLCHSNPHYSLSFGTVIINHIASHKIILLVEGYLTVYPPYSLHIAGMKDNICMNDGDLKKDLKGSEAVKSSSSSC
jgi:hypothetical protein